MGPSENGFWVFDIETSGFDHEIETSNLPNASSLQVRIDNYWDELRDRREEIGGVELTEEDLVKKLRSLGYIK